MTSRVKMRRSLAAISSFAIISSVLAACGGSGSGGTSGSSSGGSLSPSQVKTSTGLSATYQEAKKEGVLNWDGALAQQQLQPVINAFEKQYPGIKINFRDVKPGSGFSEYQAQEVTHKVHTDVSTAAAGSPLVTFLKLGLVQTGVNWSALKVPASAIFDKNFVKIYSLATVIIYNKNLISKADAPKSWNDLLKPKFKGKIAIDGRGNWMWAFAEDPSLGQQAGIAFAKKLAAQKPSYKANLGAVIPAVASGQYEIGTSTVNQILYAQKHGSPIAIAPVSPPDVISIYNVMLKNAPDPAAAKLFMAWIASPKGQQALNPTYSTAISNDTQCPGPGTAEQTALCKIGLKWHVFTTLAKYKAQTAYTKKVEQAFGTYTGK